jgi:uncharacterized protein YndB with AHSA1/START domain
MAEQVTQQASERSTERATQQTSERSTEHATFTIERHYDAAPARVFAAFADPAAKARWFGPTGEVERALDFTVGGREYFAVGGPGGATYTYDARYEEIVPDTRIVYAYTLDRDEKRMSVSVATVEFEAAGAGTRLILTEQGVFLDGADTPAEREHGTREMFEKLAAVL